MDRKEKIYRELLERLVYHRDTGSFSWRDGEAKWVKSRRAGSAIKNGYVNIRHYGSACLVHRMVWLAEFDELPDGEIDHINHIKTDNRITNLRVTNTYLNSKNCEPSKNNTSGHNGVIYNKDQKKWHARIKVNYKQIHLGSFDRREDAINARKQANIKYGFHENHGVAIR